MEWGKQVKLNLLLPGDKKKLRMAFRDTGQAADVIQHFLHSCRAMLANKQGHM